MATTNKKSTSKKTNNKKSTNNDAPKRKAKIYRQYIQAKKDGNTHQVNRLGARIKRMEARKREMNDPKRKALLKKFNEKFGDQKIDWNDKLKKANLWQGGMNMIPNLDKYLLLKAKGAEKKRMLKAFEDKKAKAMGATSTAIKEYRKENPIKVTKKASIKKSNKKASSKKSIKNKSSRNKKQSNKKAA